MNQWHNLNHEKFRQTLGEFCLVNKITRDKPLPISLDLVEALTQFLTQDKARLCCDQQGEIVGIVSDRDFLRFIQKGQLSDRPFSSGNLGDILSRRLTILESSASIADGLHHLNDHQFRHIILKDTQGHLVLSIRELLSFFQSEFKQELSKYLINGDSDVLLNIHDENFSLDQFSHEPHELNASMLLHPLSRLLRSSFLKFSESSMALDILNEMLSSGEHAVLILEYGTLLKGIITERDLLRAFSSKPEQFLSLTAKEVMSPKPKFLTLKHNLAHALNFMYEMNFRQIIITDEDRIPLGIVSLQELLFFIARFLPVDQGPG